VIVVTGGTGVLGQAFITALANAGATVGILGRNEAKAKERAAAIEAAGGKATALIADVQQEQQLVACRQLMLDKYGQIDGLVNGAGGNVPEGIVQPEDDIFSMNVEGMKKALDVNLWGTILPSMVFGKAMAERGHGSIVNISSVSVEKVLTKVLGYSMGKASVDMFTKWFAVEVANRYGNAIRINGIVPGFFLTAQNKNLLTDEQGGLTERGKLILSHTPFKQFGQPADLGGALVFLMSDAAAFVHGTNIVVDGGYTSFSGI
jgi:NAD(P)-dependent dehydrogenase (short-subunit alcohol dehydrogenase family)